MSIAFLGFQYSVTPNSSASVLSHILHLFFSYWTSFSSLSCSTSTLFPTFHYSPVLKYISKHLLLSFEDKTPFYTLLGYTYSTVSRDPPPPNPVIYRYLLRLFRPTTLCFATCYSMLLVPRYSATFLRWLVGSSTRWRPIRARYFY